ncbi:MAG: DnaJ domain-containing protein [bacterium]|nr:DnaJ domain-containing protein [bacterium]
MSDDLAGCYAVLDVEPTATAEAIKIAYLDLVKVWHPDRFASEGPRLRTKVEEKLKAINLAYERLRTGAPIFQAASRNTDSAAAAPDLRPVHFGGSWGYVNGDGRLVITPRFEEAMPFEEGLAQVREKGRYGYIDSHGDCVIYPEFVAARAFHRGLAAVVLTERWGFIDQAGRFLVNPLYEDCGDFSDGLAAVCWRGRWGFVDRGGAFAVNPRYDGARGFTGNWAEVRLGERWGRVNRNGEAFFDHEAEQLGDS